jgi:ABC-type multidrug transport system fused ATPase/permease subunit
MIMRLRQNIFGRILDQEISFFDESSTGELINRLSSDTQVVQTSVTNNISSLFHYFIHIIGSLAVMCYLEITLTLILVIIVPIVVLIALKYGQIVENLRKKFQDQLAEASTIAEESISNVRKLRQSIELIQAYICLGTIRIFGSEGKIIKNYNDNVFKSFVIGKKLAFNDGLFASVVELLTAVGISIVMW